MSEKIKRSCAYCGEGDKCRCTYRFKRMGGTAIQIHNTMRESTVAEFREQFESHTKNMLPDAHVAWMFSCTKLDEKKMAKADAKRQAEKVAARLKGE